MAVYFSPRSYFSGRKVRNIQRRIKPSSVVPRFYILIDIHEFQIQIHDNRQITWRGEFHHSTVFRQYPTVFRRRRRQKLISAAKRGFRFRRFSFRFYLHRRHSPTFLLFRRRHRHCRRGRLILLFLLIDRRRRMTKFGWRMMISDCPRGRRRRRRRRCRGVCVAIGDGKSHGGRV